MVTPVVLEKLNSQGLLMPKIPKNMPNRDAKRAIFKIKTIVLFSFLIICIRVHLGELRTQIHELNLQWRLLYHSVLKNAKETGFWVSFHAKKGHRTHKNVNSVSFSQTSEKIISE